MIFRIEASRRCHTNEQFSSASDDYFSNTDTIDFNFELAGEVVPESSMLVVLSLAMLCRRSMRHRCSPLGGA